MASDHFERLIRPSLRFFWGLALMLAFVLTRTLGARAVMVLVFGGCATLAGKRLRWGYFAFLVLSIAAFNLISPWGAVLWQWGPVRITSGAALSGLRKGFTVVGLVFVSLFSVSPRLRFPGRMGRFLAQTLLFYELLYDRKTRIHRRTLIEDVDRVLEETLAEGATLRAEPDARPGPTTTSGGLIVAASTALAVAAALLPGSG